MSFQDLYNYCVIKNFRFKSKEKVDFIVTINTNKLHQLIYRFYIKITVSKIISKVIHKHFWNNFGKLTNNK